MKHHLIIWASGVIFLIYISNAAAQQTMDSTLFNIETSDGNEFIGYILERDSILLLSTIDYGVLRIRMPFIKKISPVHMREIVGGAYWPENPQAARYFWAPNGYGLRAGEGYYQNVWVLFNQVSVGLTDHISMGGGFIPLFLFDGAPTPVWITPKISFPVVNDKFNIGGGALLGTVVGEEESGFGILYGSFTLGNRNNNFSTGFGYGYAGRSWAKSPVVNFSGMVRTGARGYLLSENYYIPMEDDNLVLMSFGGRQIIKKASVDYGLFIPVSPEIDSFIVIPWLGIVFPFGNTGN